MFERVSKYDPAAYRFVRQSLNFGLEKLSEPRHISGNELLDFISEYGRLQFGPFMQLVLEEWGVYGTLDFGNIVFDLVDQNIMSKQPHDSIDDFREGYDFSEEFDPSKYDYLVSIRKELGINILSSKSPEQSKSDPGF